MVPFGQPTCSSLHARTLCICRPLDTHLILDPAAIPSACRYDHPAVASLLSARASRACMRCLVLAILRQPVFTIQPLALFTAKQSSFAPFLYYPDVARDHLSAQRAVDDIDLPPFNASL